MILGDPHRPVGYPKRLLKAQQTASRACREDGSNGASRIDDTPSGFLHVIVEGVGVLGGRAGDTG